MKNQHAKELRKQIRNVTQELLPEVLKQEMFATIKYEVEKSLREMFGARIEAINEAVMSQLKGMDDRSKDVQQFLMNQVQSELGRTAPKVQVDKTLPDSATLVPSE